MFQCSSCGRNFVSIDVFIFHLKENHRDLKDLACSLCHQRFQDLSRLKKHLRKHVVDLDNDTNNDIESFVDATSPVVTSANGDVDQMESRETRAEERTSNINIHEISEILRKGAVNFTLNLHNQTTLTRKDVKIVQENLVDEIFAPLSNYLKDKIRNEEESVLRNKIQHLIQIDLKDIFPSEYIFIQKLIELDLFQYPQAFNINNKICTTLKKGIPTLSETKAKGIIMPIEFQLRKYFESEGTYDAILKNYNNLMKSDKLKNFVNGEKWKTLSSSFGEKIVFPLFLYFDDFQINNCLGSHKTSLCGGYYILPIIPEEYKSKLDHIFISSIVTTKDMREHGIDHAFYYIVKEFKKLYEQGITITVNAEVKQIYFLVTTIMGDNAGVNAALGFSKSFFALNYCRDCRLPKEICRKTCREVQSSLRTKENYEEDLTSRSYGINEDSIFNKLPLYHVTSNFYFDIMHDIFEGVCDFDISRILDHFINDKMYFTLQDLNNRKQNFSYGSKDVKNLSPPITQENLNNRKLKMSASERKTFAHFLPLMIGDLVPMTDEIWKVLLCLINIIDLLLLPEFTESELSLLDKLITQHHSLYIKYFGDLMPKHHFMVHYTTCIKKSGPLKHLWNMRCEAKHQQMKQIANNCNSRINIKYTLGIKCCLKFAAFIKEKKIYKTTQVFSCTKRGSLRDTYKNIHLIFDDPVDVNMSVNFAKQCTIFNHFYTQLNYLITKTNEIFEIRDFFAYEDKIYVIGRKIITIWAKHFASHKIISDTNDYHVTLIDRFISPPLVSQKVGEIRYIRPKIL